MKIGVRDEEEPPSKPTVTVTSPAVITTLHVIWEAENTGPDITGYDLQYRQGSGSFSDDNCGSEGEDNCKNITPGVNGTTDTTIQALDADTSYSVQVRAINPEGTSSWSNLVTVKTNKDTNQVPTFTDTATPVELDVDENSSSRDVGNAVDATDDISTSMTYSLGGPDASLFTIVSSSGQIRSRSSLNHEDPECSYATTDDPTECTYSVRVKVDDRAGGSAYKSVTIMVNDVDEPPIAPGTPRVTATKDTGWSLDVSWSEPRNTGKPPINDYDIEYRKVKSGTDQDPWENWPHGTEDNPTANSTERSAKITRRLPATDADPLEPRTQYEVRVKAKNGER